MNKKRLNFLAWGSILFATLSFPATASERNYDIRLSPAVLLFGAIDGEVNIKLADNMTIAPMGTYWSLSNAGDEFSITTIGVRAYWHLDSAFQDGVYLSPFYRLWSLSVDTTNNLGNSATGSVNAHQIGATIGYLWQWDNFNTSLGIGYSFLDFGTITAEDNAGNKSEESASDVSAGGIAIDYTIGWAF